ncbi:hypothetical protein TNCV_790951 [Trichonephila clavipes]|nr:hypothetical protein TNCV_790951 [Trichonephila clavipes]
MTQSGLSHFVLRLYLSEGAYSQRPAGKQKVPFTQTIAYHPSGLQSTYSTPNRITHSQCQRQSQEVQDSDGSFRGNSDFLVGADLPEIVKKRWRQGRGLHHPN